MKKSISCGLLPLFLLLTGCGLSATSTQLQPPVDPIRHHHLPDPLEQAEAMWERQKAWELAQSTPAVRQETPRALVASSPLRKSARRQDRRLRRMARASSPRLLKRSFNNGSTTRLRKRLAPVLVGAASEITHHPAEVRANDEVVETEVRTVREVELPGLGAVPPNEEFVSSSVEKYKSKCKNKRKDASPEGIRVTSVIGDSQTQPAQEGMNAG